MQARLMLMIKYRSYFKKALFLTLPKLISDYILRGGIDFSLSTNYC